MIKRFTVKMNVKIDLCPMKTKIQVHSHSKKKISILYLDFKNNKSFLNLNIHL